MESDLETTPDSPLPSGHPLAGQEHHLDSLRECGRLFHGRGWSVGTSSNYSVVLANDPVELIVTASGMDKGRLTRNDFVRIGPDGNPLIENQPRSSAETMLHVVLAQTAGTGCILHTHSVWGTLLSDYFFAERGFEVEGYEMLKGLEGVETHQHRQWVPVFDNTQDIPALASQVEEALAREKDPLRHGFLIRNHGLYTWGPDLFAARRHVEIFEFLFECVGRKLSLPVK